MAKAIARTNSGYPLNFADPDPRHVDIVDIGLGLSKECRWNGQLPPDEFLSVAQHCVMASHLVAPHLQFEALLHDAEEAYIRDLASPIKALMPQYVAVAARITGAIRQRFDLPVDEHSPEVKVVDSALQDLEASAIFEGKRTFDFWTPKQSYERFMERFDQLYPAHLERLREQGVHTFHDRLALIDASKSDTPAHIAIQRHPRESCSG